MHGFADWFTGVIAVATLAYVVVTFLLWKATKRSADAAKAAADAAKKSADTATDSARLARESYTALHRPYLGVSKVEREMPPHDPHWQVNIELENYGTLAATDVKVIVQHSQAGGQFHGEDTQSTCEILPKASVSHRVVFELDKQTQLDMNAGRPNVQVKIGVHYGVTGGGRWQHFACFRYVHRTRTFEISHSKTETVGG